MPVIGRKYHMARRGVFASKTAWHLLSVLRVRGACDKSGLAGRFDSLNLHKVNCQ
jgi:hypothetical protein